MRDLFQWYFPPTVEEIKTIWKEGILTVDTNVLLDLYRYHQDTRQTLLESLNSFKGRAWLSYQVADEFFRNRNRVIISANEAFNEVENNIAEIKKSINEPLNKLKSNRIIPNELEEALKSNIMKALVDAEKSFIKIRDDYPDYTKKDPILNSITKLFDANVGLPYESSTLVEVLKEAKRRKDNKIPPGYKDSDKEGDRPYGDYIIWRQILDHIKKVGKPLILVTSEQKEDWWEKKSGKTIGPLYELLKEFYEETNQRFLFYRTDRFLEFSNENSGKKANNNAVQEIRDVVRQRETPLTQVSQNIITAEKEKATGTLKVRLLQPVYKFNFSGHFEPELCEVPKLRVRLLTVPNEIPAYSLRCGIGTKFDFHVFLKSIEYGILLPIGEYIFEYDAIVVEELES